MAGGRVHADPDELRGFANDIESFAERAFDDIQGLQVRLSGLDWDDAQQQRFSGELTETVDRLRTFLDAVRDLASELRRTAAPLDEYHNK